MFENLYGKSCEIKVCLADRVNDGGSGPLNYTGIIKSEVENFLCVQCNEVRKLDVLGGKVKLDSVVYLNKNYIVSIIVLD